MSTSPKTSTDIIPGRHFRLWKVTMGETYAYAVAFSKDDAVRTVRSWIGEDWPYQVGKSVEVVLQLDGPLAHADAMVVVSKRIDPETRLY